MSGAAPLVSRTHSHMRTCSWWAIVTARITVRTTSHRRRLAQAIVSRHRPGPRRLRERLGPGDVRVWRVRRECPGRGRSLRALGRPMRIRFITDLPPVIDKERPGSFVDSAFASNSSGGCGRRYRAGTGPVSRTGGSYLRSAAGRGRFSVPSRGASPRPIRAWRALLPQACGPAAADSRARKVARHRQVRAVALDQAADDARGIKHALDIGVASPAVPVPAQLLWASLPPLHRLVRTVPDQALRTARFFDCGPALGRARLTLPMLLPPRARLWDPLAAAAPGSAILCARASHGPLRRCRCRRALGAARTRLP